jgi:hypothetical protein
MAKKPVDYTGPAAVTARRVHKAGVKKAMPARSNKGGAERGQVRAAAVKKAPAVPARSNRGKKANPPAPNSQRSMAKSFAAGQAATVAPMPAWRLATVNPPARSGVPAQPLPITLPSQRRPPIQGPTRAKKAT